MSVLLKIPWISTPGLAARPGLAGGEPMTNIPFAGDGSIRLLGEELKIEFSLGYQSNVCVKFSQESMKSSSNQESWNPVLGKRN